MSITGERLLKWKVANTTRALLPFSFPYSNFHSKWSKLTYPRVALEAKVDDHNGGKQHDGEDNKHQEQVDEKD